MSSTRKKGYLYAVFSAILFGISTPAAKYLVGKIDPWLLAGLLYFGSGIGLSITLLLRIGFTTKYISNNVSLTKADWKWLGCVTLLGGILGPTFLMLALVTTGAATTSLILNLESVFTAIIAWTIFKEHTDNKLILGVILIVAGSFILGWDAQLHFRNIWGIVLVVCACFVWAVDNNLTRKISASDPLKIVAIKSTVAGATNTLLAITFGAMLPVNFNILAVTFGVGFVGYGLSLILFILALRHIGTARTSAYFALAPFIGVCCSILFLNELLSWQLLLAGSLMGIGVWLHLTEYHTHSHQHEALIHAHSHIHDEHHQHEHLPGDPPGEPHSHLHTHAPIKHSHRHYPDIHHRHSHKED